MVIGNIQIYALPLAQAKAPRADIAVRLMNRFKLKAISIGCYGVGTIYTNVPSLREPQMIASIKEGLLAGGVRPSQRLVADSLEIIKAMVPPSHYEVAALIREREVEAKLNGPSYVDLFIMPFCGRAMIELFREHFNHHDLARLEYFQSK